jgi:hypothetical protein
MSRAWDKLFAATWVAETRKLRRPIGCEIHTKHEGMNEKRELPGLKQAFIELPAYPFSGREIFNDLRRELGRGLNVNLTVRRLATMMGASPSTAHRWLELYRHPQIIAFMSLLERLSAERRHAFVGAHCRVLATFDHSRLMNNSTTRTYVFGLLRKKAGLTLITRGTEFSRQFVLNAFGASYSVIKSTEREVAGVDMHRPTDLVPLNGVYYVDTKMGRDRMTTSLNKIWPGLLTSRAPLFLFNRVWSTFPELRPDIINLCRNSHVVLADLELPGPKDLKQVPREVHLLTISQKYDASGLIRLGFRRLKP